MKADIMGGQNFPACLLAYCLGFSPFTQAFDGFCELPELVSGDAASVVYSDIIFDLFTDEVEARIFDVNSDGLDDIILLGFVNPDKEWDGEGREGRIYINEGENGFVRAAGDVPFTVTPRENLYADFDSNGLIDFFIADHGWDASPFPGFSNTLMLQFESGWVNASSELPPDPEGFTHNAAIADVDNDGDVDIFVLNQGFKKVDNLKYWLINDGAGNFSVNDSLMPDSLPRGGVADEFWRAWAAAAEDLDGDGFADLVIGGTTENGGASRIYWGGNGGFSDASVTLLEFSDATRSLESEETTVEVVTAKVFDVDGDGKLDLLLGGYNGWFESRFTELWMNAGNRVFTEQSQRRLGRLATSSKSRWPLDYRFFDFNDDGLTDIVPEYFLLREEDVIAWLGDGSGFFVPLEPNGVEGSGDLDGAIGHYVTSSKGRYAVRFYEYDGELHSNSQYFEGSSSIKAFPCYLGNLPPLTPVQKVDLEEALLR